jgi:hypothetical protein
MRHEGDNRDTFRSSVAAAWILPDEAHRLANIRQCEYWGLTLRQLCSLPADII